MLGSRKLSSDQSSVRLFCSGVPVSSSRLHGCAGLTSQMALSSLMSLQFMFLRRWPVQATVEESECRRFRGRGGPRVRHGVGGAAAGGVSYREGGRGEGAPSSMMTNFQPQRLRCLASRMTISYEVMSTGNFLSVSPLPRRNWPRISARSFSGPW